MVEFRGDSRAGPGLPAALETRQKHTRIINAVARVANGKDQCVILASRGNLGGGAQLQSTAVILETVLRRGLDVFP